MASELNWTNVDVAKLPLTLQEQYAEMKDAYREYAARKAEFEAAMQAAYGAKLPAGKELKFGYMFGKLSIAVGPARERKAGKGKAEQTTLSDWLNAQIAGNRAA